MRLRGCRSLRSQLLFVRMVRVAGGVDVVADLWVDMYTLKAVSQDDFEDVQVPEKEAAAK